MFVGFQLVWNDELRIYLEEFEKRLEEINLFGIVSFKGGAYILKNDLMKPECIVLIHMVSPLDMFMPKILKRFSFKVGLRKKGYKDNIKVLSDQDIINKIFFTATFKKGVYDGTSGSFIFSGSEEE